MIDLLGVRSSISYRNELLIVGSVLLLIISLPVLVVVSVANAGIEAVSDSLVSVNPTMKLIEIRDASGVLMKTLPITSSWPVGGVVTFEFAALGSPWQATHTGIDIADPKGKTGRPVTTFMEGTVSKVVNVDNEFGRYVYIDHGNDIISQYWHLRSAVVTVGEHVKPGDIIGLEGSTGRSTGPHLHFEIQVHGIPVNPRLFIDSSPEVGL